MAFKTVLLYVFSYFGLFSTIMLLVTYFENRRLLRKPEPFFPTVSVIIPAYNEEDIISQSIESLLDLDYPREKLDIIVVDDGSTDDTLRVADRYSPKGVRVFTKQNGGKASALNYGLTKAKGEFVAPLDADCFVGPKALERMIGYFRRDEVTAVGPSIKICDADSFFEKVQRIEFLSTTIVRKIFTALGGLHLLPGPFSVFRKSFLEDHGGWDETTLTEDLEISLRIESLKDHVIENSLSANVYTPAAPTLKEAYNQRLRWFKGFIENMWRYRRMFLSPSYGNFGMFVLPSTITSVVLGVILVSYSAVKFILNLANNIYDMYLIGWDITSWFQIDPDWFFINTSASRLLIYFLLVLTVFMIWLARRHDESEGSIKSDTAYFLATYWFFAAFCWMSAAYHKVTGRSVKWKTLRWNK